MLLLLLIPIIYLGIAVRFFIKAKTWQGKTFVAAIFVLIPLADVLAGRIYLHYLCATQTGQEIFKIVELGPEYLLKPGEIDKSRLNEKGDGYAVAKGGEINRELLRLRYDFQGSKLDRDFAWRLHVAKRETQILDRKTGTLKTGTLLSKATSFLYYGGWVANSTGLHVNTTHCSEETRPGGDGYIHSALFERTFVVNK